MTTVPYGEAACRASHTRSLEFGFWYFERIDDTVRVNLQSEVSALYLSACSAIIKAQVENYASRGHLDLTGEV